MTLGVGIGWLAEEFKVIGIPFEERTHRTDEYIQAMRALWSQDETFAGRFTSFENARSNPKPVQEGGVPIVVGGHTKGAARRAGRLGDGFFPARGDIPVLIDEMKRAAKDAGRDPDAIEVTTGGGWDVDAAKALEDQGVSRIVFPPPTFDPNDMGRALGEISENFIQKIA